MAEPYKNQETKKWDFVFDYYLYGQRKQVRRRGFQTKREANDEMVRLQKEVQDNGNIHRSKKTVLQFMEDWMENVRKFSCDPVTFYNNKLYIKNHIKPSELGHTQLKDLSPEFCQKFISDMHNNNLARSTILAIYSIINVALNKAVEYNLIRLNPMKTVVLPKGKKREQHVWNTEQVNHFLKHTKNSRYHCAYMLALLTGMRQGEILGLRWCDIDFESKVISVSQRLTNYGHEIRQGAKTASGVRKISISNILKEELLLQKERYENLKEERNYKKNLDLVIFSRISGGIVLPATLNKAYRKDVLSCGLPHIRFHDLRHTHSTMLIQNDINPKVISERLGHSTIGITLDIYSHVLPEMQQEVADKLDDVICI